MKTSPQETQPIVYMMRDCKLRAQVVDQRISHKINSYIQYFHTHFLSSVKVMEYIGGEWKRSNQSYDCLNNLPLHQILWGHEHSHSLYVLVKQNGQFIFLKAKKYSDGNSHSRLRLYCSETLAPLICSVMNERVYTHYIHHTHVV